jgi:hypothetical protein
VAKKTKRRDEGARGGPYGNRGRGAGRNRKRGSRESSMSASYAGCTASWWRCRRGSRPRPRKSVLCSRAGTPPGKGGTVKAITRTRQPAGVPCRRPARPHRTRAVTDVPATIHTAPSRQGEVVIFDRSWYNRGGVERVMGFCPPRPGHPIPATGPRCREGRGRLGHRAGEVLAGGQPGRADPPAPEPDRRPTQALEALGDGPQVQQPLVRLFTRPLEVDLSRQHRLGTATLDGPLLSLGASLGREDAGRALPLAVLVAGLVALVRVAGGRRDNRDPGHVPCLLVTGTG